MNKLMVLILMSIYFFTLSFAFADVNNGLVAFYEFENNTLDSSGNNNHGTPVGKLNYVKGKFGNAIKFDGEDDLVNIGKIIVSPNNLTFSAWIKKISEFSSWNDIIAGDCGSPLFALKNNYVYWGGQCNSPMHAYSAQVDITNNWHHIVATYDGNTLKLYWDGKVKISQKTQGSFNSNIPVGIGGALSHINEEFFHGIIDNIRIYNRALTISEVEELFSEKSVPAVSGCIKFYGEPIKKGSAMLIQSGEYHQTINLDMNGCFNFKKVNKDLPFSVILRDNKK